MAYIFVTDETSQPELFDGDALKITAYRFFSPDGNTSDRIGVIPTLYLPDGAVDGALALAGSTLTSVSRWFSTGATIAAVVEHGYQELQVRGSFDPEVMSLVYLINAIGKSNSLQASLLAWAATFGRHIVPRAPREQVYLVRRREQETTLIPVRSPRSGSDYAGAMLRRSAQMLAK